jgi:hypothetical protein
MQYIPFLFRSALIFTGLSIGLNGCNSSSDPAPVTGGNNNVHSALISPCSLLSSAEAAIIMGKPVLASKEDTTSGYITHCVYTGSIDPDFFLATHLDFTVTTTAGMQAHLGPSMTVPTFFNSEKTTLLTVANEVPLTGIGNDAFWYTKSGKLYFYKGDVTVDIIYRPHGTPVIDTSAAARAGSTLAAQNIAARL